MTDSIDKKSKEKHDNLDVDLDAMPDEAESFHLSMNEFQADEEAVDRLLMKDADDAPVQSDVDEDVSALEALNDFSDFSDFDEPETVRQNSPLTAVAEVDESERVAGNSSPVVEGKADDFFGLGDDFDESDLIWDDATEASISVVAELITAGEGQHAVIEEPGVDEETGVLADLVEQPSDGEDAGDSLLLDADFDSGDALEKTDGKADEFLDDFDESDMIQNDEVDDWADLLALNEEPQSVDEESFDDLPDIARDGVYAASQSGTGAADENNIDSPSLDDGFDAEDAGLIETDDFFQLDEVSDELPKQTEGVQSAETEILSTQDQEDDFLLPDFDITADTEISDVGREPETKEDQEDIFGSIDFLDEDDALDVFGEEAAEPKSGSNEAVVEPDSKQAPATDAVMKIIDDVKLNPSEFIQEDIKKQLEDAENKVKRAKLFSYVAMGVGAVALSAAAGLGVMIYSAKTEVSKLTEAVSTLEASLAKNAANNPNDEINAVMNSVVQLNQQVYGFITELKGNPQFPIDFLNDKVPNIVAKQGMVSKALDMLQVKMGGSEEKVFSAPAIVAEPAKVEAVPEPVSPAKVENEHEIAQAKSKAAPEHVHQAKEGAADAHEQAKEGTDHEHAQAKEGTGHEPAPTKKESVHEPAPTKERAIHEAAPVKLEVVPETAPAKVKTPPKAVTAKPITIAKTVVKQEPVKENKQVAPGKWGVNLGAFKQEWFAKSKAAEYAQQGVLAEVMPVHEKNVTMYRLRVMGYKTKAEANSNTARIKKALNLDSVWVSDN